MSELFLELMKMLPIFVAETVTSLIEGQQKHGDEWFNKPIKGQETRIVERIGEYYSDFKLSGAPMPWAKIAGLAFIGWVRTKIQDYSGA